MKYVITKEILEEIVKTSLSIAEVCRKLNIRPAGGNYRTVKFKIQKYSIDISHFTGQGWNTGLKFIPKKAQPLEEILVENSSFLSIYKLKYRLIKEGFKQEICEVCNLKEWLNKPIPLELHHINGNNLDHRLINLQILCANCHAQTDTHKGKNKLSALSEKRDVEYRKFKELPAEKRDNLEPSLVIKEGAETLHGKPKVNSKKKCLLCDTLVSNNANKYCSYNCSRKALSINVPTKEQLIEAFDKYHSFLQVGNYFNVSDNSIRKWCLKRGILAMVKKKSRPQT